MLKKKIVMLGSFAVGKTSLVRRFVRSIFTEKYHTTIGVKIDQKVVDIDGEKVNLILWDLHGEDEFQKVKPSYMKGSSGYFLVVDGTRRNTLGIAEKLHEFAVEHLGGQVPFLLLINKNDLTDQWDVSEEHIEKFRQKGWTVLTTSAKTGDNVENAFRMLTKEMILKQK